MSFSVKQRTDFGAAVKASVNIGFVRSQIMAAAKVVARKTLLPPT